jgi:beta-hydroxyacyl-ACP dehydratase FabZ
MTTETQPQAQPAVPAPPPFDWKTAPIKSYDFAGLQKILPHRYPFLLVDRADILQENKFAVGYKAVSGNEEFFQGHFPGFPIMPGVLIVEALAQTSIVLMASRPTFEGKMGLFLAIEEAKFRAPVKPGMLLELRVEMLRAGTRAGKVRGEAYVNGDLAAEANLSFAITDRPK